MSIVSPLSFICWSGHFSFFCENHGKKYLKRYIWSTMIWHVKRIIHPWPQECLWFVYQLSSNNSSLTVLIPHWWINSRWSHHLATLLGGGLPLQMWVTRGLPVNDILSLATSCFPSTSWMLWGEQLWSATTSCLCASLFTTGSRQWSQLTTDWKLWSGEPE